MQEEMERGLLPKPFQVERGGRQQTQNVRPEQQSAQARTRPWSGGGGRGRSWRGDAGNSSWRGGRRRGGNQTDNLDGQCEPAECELGFYYESNGRKSAAPNNSAWASGRLSNSRRCAEPSSAFYNKEIFMQANCQFVVKATAGEVTIDYTAYTKDPDLLVNWDLVEEVRAPGNDAQCPICLYPPKVAKVAKCGHAYCYTCALQYIRYDNERKSKKCAICAEHIYIDDLRSLMPLTSRPPAVGDELTMTLMRKTKGDTRVAPIDAPPLDERPQLPDVSADESRFSKLLTSTSSDTERRIIERELEQLETARLEADANELVYYEEALRAIMRRRADLAAELLPADSSLPPERLLVGAVGSNVSEAAAAADAGVSGCAGAARRAKLTSLTEEPAHYFYQSADGQHVYLHAVNWQCLLHEYGAMHDCPPSIAGRVVSVEYATVSAALRKRIAYLRHLPLACGIAIVELELTPPLLSRETLRHFGTKLSQRRRLRQARAREERQLSRRKDEEEKRLMGLAEDVVVTASAMRDLEPPECPTFTDADPPLPTRQDGDETPAGGAGAGMSFAQAARARAQRSTTQPRPPASSAAAVAAIVAPDSEEAPRPTLSMGDTLGDLIQAQLMLSDAKKQQKLKKKQQKQKRRTEEPQPDN